MGGKDEKNTKNVTNPREGVKEVDPSGCVLGDEKVEESQSHRMSREHVI